MKLSSYESYNFLLDYSSEATLAKVKFSSQNEALQNKTKTSRSILPFITTLASYSTESNKLGQIYSEPAIVAYTEEESLKDLQVRAKIPSHIQQQQFGVINGKGQVTI